MSIHAQEVVAPTSIEELFGKLVQLQEANLGVARQIAETQLRASDAIEVAVREAGITDPALLKLAQTFIDNGRTLAAVVLSPMALQNVSAGETLKRLLRNNIVLLESSRAQARTNADLAGAFEKYAVLQAQSEDLLVAFANGWDRYGEVIRTAEIAGMIRPGSFDAVDARWTLANPQSEPQAVATVEEPPSLPKPEPALTGNPTPRLEPEPATQPEPAAEVAIATPAPLTPETPADPNRLDPTGPLALAEIQPDGSGRIGDWMVETDGPDLFTASSANTNPDTADRIAGIRIACGENGTLYYQVAAKTEYASFAVYSDDSLTRAVSAESNIISGPEATALADTLRLGYDWASRDPNKRRQLTITAIDDDEIPAQFSPSGYMEARGKVLDACVAGIVAKAMGTGTQTAEADAPAASPVASGELPKGAVIKPDLVAPVPKTRPRTFKSQGPVDIMAGT